MKAVIMESAPWVGTMLAFPVGNELLIDHLLLALKQQGVREVAVVSCEQDPYVRELVCRAGRACGMTVFWRTEPVYRGTAGGLQAVEDFLDTPTFLAIHANVYLRDVDLEAARGGSGWLDSVGPFLSGAWRIVDYAAVCRVVRWS
jgi:sporulation-control protein spo0M